MSKDEEFELNFSFLKKINFSNKKWITVLALLIPLFLAFFIRIQPMYLPSVDDWAESSVYNSVENQVAQQINSQYPNLPLEQRQKLINEQVSEMISSSSGEYESQVRNTANYFKNRFRYVDNKPSTTYLGDLDSYYYLRHSRNMLEKGTICDSVNDGTCWNDLMLSPEGRPMRKDTLHPYAIVFTHKFLSFFNKDQVLWNSSFWVQIIIGMLSVVPAFFLARRVAGNIGGFTAGMLIAGSQMFLSRSLGSDTDLYHIIAPLLLIWLFFEAVDSKSWSRRITFSVLAGFATGLASFMWGVWWYFFDLVIIAIIGYLGYSLIRLLVVKRTFFAAIRNKLFVENVSALLIFIVASCVFVSLFYGFDSFISGPLSPLRTTSLLDAAKADLWPNVYTTVAELNPTNIPNAISSLGGGKIGKFLFFLTGLGVLLSLFSRKLKSKDYVFITGAALFYLFLISKTALAFSPLVYAIMFSVPVITGALIYIKDREIDTKYAFFVLVWYAVSFYTLTQGVRFIIFLVPPFAIALGIFFGRLNEIFRGLKLGVHKKFATGFVLLLVIFSLWAPVSAGVKTGKVYTPSINDAWVETLEKIKLESSEDAIINSWWDFGHWFKFWADRGVTADGASQNTPRSHWLGLALQSHDEKVSVGTLRMLVCSSNQAFEVLDEQFQDTEKSQNILAGILPLDRNEARVFLEENGVVEVDRILDLAKCENPPEDYFITSADMVGKAGVWAHFGLWDFDRAWMYTNIKGVSQADAVNMLKDRFGFSDSEANSYYSQVNQLSSERQANSWISPWPSYVGGWRNCQEITNLTVCNVNVALENRGNQQVVLDKVVIPKNYSATFLISTVDTQSGTRLGTTEVSPNRLVVASENLDVYDLSGGIYFDVVLRGNRVLIVSPELSLSTFTKLFYLDGQYSLAFEKFHDVTSFTGQRIITWKVVFDE